MNLTAGQNVRYNGVLYMKGDNVTYNGVVYENLIDSNVWSPEAYPAGWQAVEQ